LLPFEAAQVAAPEGALFAHERHVGLVDRLSRTELHDLEHEPFVARLRTQLAALERAQQLERVSADLGLLVLREAARVPSPLELRDRMTGQERAIAGQMRQRRHEHDEIGALERIGQRELFPFHVAFTARGSHRRPRSPVP
jgi:hypothetical protein